MEEKEKRKRKVSVLTIFIWIALVITMSVVVISGINKSNALESDGEVETRKVTINMDITEYLEYTIGSIEGFEDYSEDLKDTIKNLFIGRFKNDMSFILNEYYDIFNSNRNEINGNSAIFTIEDNIATYEFDIPTNIEYMILKIENFGEYDVFRRFYIEEEGEMVEYFNYSKYYKETLYKRKIDKDKNVYNFAIKRIKPTRVNIDLTNIDEEDKKEINMRAGIPCSKVENIRRDYFSSTTKRIEENENKEVYDIYLLPDENISIELYSGGYGVFEDGVLLDNFKRNSYIFYNNTKPYDEKKEYNFEIKKIPVNEETPKIYSSIKWDSSINCILKFEGKNRKEFIPEIQISYPHMREFPYFVIFAEKLDENFTLSKKYENDPKWLIVNEDEIKNTELKFDYYFSGSSYSSNKCREAYNNLVIDLEENQEIPKYIFATFFEVKHCYYNYYDEEVCFENEKRYIYIKDKNILYCVSDKDDILESISLDYKGSNEDINDIKYNFTTKATCFYRIHYGSSGYSYLEYMDIPLNQKQIKYLEDEKTEVVVNKI